MARSPSSPSCEGTVFQRQHSTAEYSTAGNRHAFMEAEPQLPRGAQWQYEPKWDGFRCLLIRDSSQIRMQSKGGRDLTRYFPEVAAAASALSPKTLTLDGELIIQLDDGYSFDALLQRVHPAASRIKRLAEETPATFMVFDMLRSTRKIFRSYRLRSAVSPSKNFHSALSRPAGTFACHRPAATSLMPRPGSTP